MAKIDTMIFSPDPFPYGIIEWEYWTDKLMEPAKVSRDVAIVDVKELYGDVLGGDDGLIDGTPNPLIFDGGFGGFGF